MAIDIIFNNYELQNVNVVSNKAVHTQFPERKIDIRQKARDDDFRILGNFFIIKRIVVEGIIKDSSNALLRTRIDALKRNIQGEDKILDIDYGDSTRRYTATVEKLNIDEAHYNIDFVPFTISFLCHAFGRATSDQNVSRDTISSVTITDETGSLVGSVGPRPTITITVVSETNMVMIKFKNTTTNEEIEVEESFNASDVLVIDCDEMTVQLNGSDHDFNGVFPTFTSGNNGYQVSVSDSGAFSINLDIDYTPLYL